jgi:hypothetical protein
MEINVSTIVEATIDHPTQFSASVAETGNQSIGRQTWKNACEQGCFQLTQAEDIAWREYLPEYGAWSDEEIAEMTPDESTALFVQFVSGDYKGLEALADNAGYDIDSLTDSQYEELTECCGGSLYPGGDGAWYYSIVI